MFYILTVNEDGKLLSGGPYTAEQLTFVVNHVSFSNEWIRVDLRYQEED